MRHHHEDSTLDTLEITIDAVQAEEAAMFWAAALGYHLLYRRDPYLVLGPVEGGGPCVLVQQVGQRARNKGAVHLDLRVRDPRREVERLEALGARVRQVVVEAETSWTVMVDPEGIPFCVCPTRRSSEEAGVHGH